MKFKSVLLISSILAASSVAANYYGKMGGRAYSCGGMGFGIIKVLFGLGLLLILWLWVIKLWRNVFNKRRK